MDFLKNIIVRIVNVILKIVFYIIITVFILYLTISLIQPKMVIKTFKYQYFVIITSSMEPVINVGDMVIIKEVDFDNLNPDDIISFYTDINGDGKDEIVTHFLDSIEEDEAGNKIYRTRRAETNEIDSWKLEEEDIIGEYIYHIPKLGKVIMFLKSPIGIIVFAIDILLIYLLIKVTSLKSK